jgi:hypothetical protein
MNKENLLVSQHIAELANEYGFNEPCDYSCYDNEIFNPLHKQILSDYEDFIVTQRGCNHDYIEKNSFFISLYNLVLSGNYTGDLKIPYNWQVSNWLRNEHNIHVVINPNLFKDDVCKYSYKVINNHITTTVTHPYEKYETAFELALLDAFKILKRIKEREELEKNEQ